MFLDEARLAAPLHHQNIVQVHDIGQEDGEYFFAMEYVHGEDVRATARAARARQGERIPLEHVVTIVGGGGGRRCTTRTSSAAPTASRSASSIATSRRRTSSSATTAA